MRSHFRLAYFTGFQSGKRKFRHRLTAQSSSASTPRHCYVRSRSMYRCHQGGNRSRVQEVMTQGLFTAIGLQHCENRYQFVISCDKRRILIDVNHANRVRHRDAERMQRCQHIVTKVAIATRIELKTNHTHCGRTGTSAQGNAPVQRTTAPRVGLARTGTRRHVAPE